MDNAILFLAVLLFGWLVIHNYAYQKGFRDGQENERDATAKRFVQFRLRRMASQDFWN